MTDLLISKIDEIPIYFGMEKPEKEFYYGRHVVFYNEDLNVYYYVREKPGNVKTQTKFASIYKIQNEVPELTEYFSVTEEIISGTVLQGAKLMILIKGPEINYIKAMLLGEDNWKDEDLYIGTVQPRNMTGPMSKSHMFKTSKAILVKKNDS